MVISHNMPHIFQITDRIHVHRLGRRVGILDPKRHTMADAVALMTGVKDWGS
uniref:Uncharacterized protein n=1 Tax=Candidatus Kentrum sp. LFY TaxID=2126342 RepID=A0A450WKS3_9GAMM|nr:MAG: hypothetical protein BECKLFY1418C_GA0070996_103318 [Candidatus Kentron sp. LFY]